ncbi:hypothetical protein J7E73_01730 [Paenibacillus albidus]|uniref:hypothetical protein n=1 Tax=Paenibacillus albidus TaxID=2041023 RepID=UPI001BEC1445|nr:hypothetical protein [Paenibacillus albidus]MBT2287865.1 hypothetical protein [Paenibacillus albidus]
MGFNLSDLSGKIQGMIGGSKEGGGGILYATEVRGESVITLQHYSKNKTKGCPL